MRVLAPVPTKKLVACGAAGARTRSPDPLARGAPHPSPGSLLRVGRSGSWPARWARAFGFLPSSLKYTVVLLQYDRMSVLRQRVFLSIGSFAAYPGVLWFWMTAIVVDATGPTAPFAIMVVRTHSVIGGRRLARGTVHRAFMLRRALWAIGRR